MQLHLLPHRTAGAAENMAADFLLLQRYPEPAHARFRHYDWRAPAFTFGFGQKIAYVREQLALLLSADSPMERVDPDTRSVDLTRRPTGGGVVDHRDDWTFALVIPRGHPLYDARATESYRQVHAALVESLRDQNQSVVLKEHCDNACQRGSELARDGSPESRASSLPRPAFDLSTLNPQPSTPPAAPTVCFIRPELYDVLHADTGAKVAGAAQKRTKHGLLFQGSIAKSVLGDVDWNRFEETFTARLADLLTAEAVPTPWPEFAEGEHDGLTEQYAASEWIEYR